MWLFYRGNLYIIINFIFVAIQIYQTHFFYVILQRIIKQYTTYIWTIIIRKIKIDSWRISKSALTFIAYKQKRKLRLNLFSGSKTFGE